MRKKKKHPVIESVLVEDYAAEGKCLSRIDGKVVFIEGVVPGDTVDLRVTKSKKDWAEAVPLKFHNYSPNRVEPRCSHTGVCGGCQWQMLPYEWQLKYKQQQVEQTLRRIGKVELPPIPFIVGADEIFEYRNKIEYTFGNKRYLLPQELKDESVNGNQDVAGFHARGFFDKVVDIDRCHLQAEPTNTIRKFIKNYALERQWSFYDIRAHQGFLRNMQVRLCSTGELMINLVVGEEDPAKIEPLLQAVLNEFPAITTLLYTVNTKWNDSIYDLHPVVFHGKGYVIEELKGKNSQEVFRFKIGPQSFFQTNTKQAEKLYQLTADFAELTGKETLYDLYCGTGSIGIFLSKGASRIVGVEQVSAAIDDAWENARLNQLENVNFFAGDVIEICRDDFFVQQGKPDVIITDPPRAGMHPELINKLLEIEAPTIVYVSCNPATQARDLQALDAKYQVTRIQPVDMFPHTLHIENIVQLKRR